MSNWIVDDAGTLINMVTGDNYELASELVGVLNNQDDEIKRLKNELFEAKKDYIIDTADISDKLYLDEMIEEVRNEIYGDDLNE